MTELNQYVIVEGWFHSKNGGDDYPFTRGFIVGPTATLELFNKSFKKKNKRSAAPDDFKAKFVKERTWKKLFHTKQK